MKEIKLFIALLLFAGFAFSQTPEFNNTISIDETFNVDAEIFPFNNETLYGTGVNGNITFYSDTSLVRVILRDSISAMEYMVYETYPMLDTVWSFTFIEECEETCFLDGFTATSMIIQIKDAVVYIDGLSWSGSPMDNVTELQRQAKDGKALEKTDELNSYIQSKGMIWRAGKNGYTNLYYADKKTLFGDKYNTFGFEFYNAGIFEVYGINEIFDPTPDIVDHFDWREKHDANDPNSDYFDFNPDEDETGNGWMTSVKCQSGCWNPDTEEYVCYDEDENCPPGFNAQSTGACLTFTRIGMMEAMMNIYHNDQHINLDLSEQELAAENDPILPRPCNTACNNGGIGPVDYLINLGVMDEASFPFRPFTDPCPPCNLQAPNPIDIIKIAGMSDFNGLNSEEIKKILIQYGPLMWRGFSFTSFPGHAMVCVGFGTIYEGLELHDEIDPVPPYSEYIGQAYFVFKNSAGPYFRNNDLGYDGGYIYIIPNEIPSNLGSIALPITSEINTYERLCLDKDNDGFFNWGIGDPPEGCSGEMDGNDNNPALGSMDENGICRIINTRFFSFENGFEGWRQRIGDGTDERDWIRHNTENTWSGIGFLPDGAVDGDFYVFFNSHTTPYDGDAILESPPIDFSDNCTYQVSFSYYLPSIWYLQDSELKVEASYDGGETWNSIWELDINNPGPEGWSEVTVAVTSNVNKLRLYAKRSPYPGGKTNFAFDAITFDKTDNTGPFIIEEDYVFSSDYHACDNIVVKLDAKLTIEPDVTLFMKPGKKIIVERDGYLYIDGGTLTSDGTTFWEGVEVWGDITDPGAKGTVRIENGGTIENANCAIKAIKTLENGAYDFDYAGGRITCDEAYFINNEIAIYYLPCGSLFPYFSKFDYCRFEVNDFIFPSANVKAMVVLSGVEGVNFDKSSFIDNRTNIDIQNKARGIYSIDAFYRVKDTGNEENSLFKNLSYGIYATGTGENEFFTVDKTHFINNLHGIYASGIDEIGVTRSNFQTYQNANPWVENYGMYLDNCSGYIVEENHFYNTNIQIKAVGLVISNSGPATNEIYKNYFSDLQYGLIAQNENRSAFGDAGLSIKCNEFSNCEYDISVTMKKLTPLTGIMFDQGSNGSSAEDPAGNQFSYTWFNDESDYYNETHNLTYWFHQNNGGYNVEPKKFSKPQVNPQKNYNFPDDFDPETACPSNFEGGGGGGGGGDTDAATMMATAEHDIDSVQGLLSLLVDGGNTDVLTSEVQNAYPPEAYALYIDLIGKSPYLSDTVLKAAINKENVLPSELLTDVLVANPQVAKADEILMEIENRTIPLTDEMKEEIMLNWYIAGAKESLESKLSAYKAQHGMALNGLLRYFHNDTLSPSPSDSIIALLQQENSLWAKYALVYKYLAQGETSLAENAMAAIAVDFPLSQSEQDAYQAQQAYFIVIKQLKQDGKDWNELDSLQLEVLYNLAYGDKSKANAYARNVLMFYDTLSYKETVQYPSFMKAGSVIPIPAQKPAERNSLKVYPNPAKDYFIIRYELNNSYAEAVINITDITGRNVKWFNVTTMRDYLVIPTLELNNGVYVVKLVLNGREMGTQKVNIQN